MENRVARQRFIVGSISNPHRSLGSYVVANGEYEHGKGGSPASYLPAEYILYQSDVARDHTHCPRTPEDSRTFRIGLPIHNDSHQS